MTATGILAGKTAVITGGKCGLGLAIAHACTREGTAVETSSCLPAAITLPVPTEQRRL